MLRRFHLGVAGVGASTFMTPVVGGGGIEVGRRCFGASPTLPDTPHGGTSSSFQSGVDGMGEDQSLDSTIEEDDSLLHCVDHLLDDLLACNNAVLINFARTKGVKTINKNVAISALVGEAYQDALSGGSRKLINAKKLLGSDVVKEITGTDSGISASWDNKTLEVQALESSAKKLLKGGGNRSKEVKVRSVSKSTGWIVQRLIRSYQDDYESVATAAVGGVHQPYKSDAQALLEKRGTPNEILAAFASYMANHVSNAYSPGMVSQSNVNDLLCSLEVVSPSLGGGDIETLERLMSLLDPISEDLEARDVIFMDGSSRTHGEENGATIVDGLSRFVFRHRDWELSNVPGWVKSLATQFEAWEAIVRNDVAALADAPKLFFDLILLNVTAIKMLHTIYTNGKPSQEIPAAYRRAVKLMLSEWCGESEADEAMIRLTQFAQMPSKTTFGADLSTTLLAQIEDSAPDGNSRPANDRLALILREVASTATRSESSAGVYELILRNAEDLRFHLRFTEIYTRLSTREKRLIRTAQPGKLNMTKTLEYFEGEFQITPVDPKPIVFMCLMLHYLCSRTTAQGQASLYHYSSCTGAEEFSVVKLGGQRGKKAAELNVALPPQLSHESWLDAKRNQGVYSVVGSTAIKGGVNDLMLISQAPMLKALDAISGVPWRINKYMLFVQESMVQEGYSFGKIEPSFYPLNYCSLKTGEIKSSTLETSLFNVKLQTKYKNQQDEDWKKLTETRSSRVHYLQALRQARALVNHDKVYFPNSLDFRGRMYPLPGRLNHTGSDPYRALLENAVPKELGDRGLYWLKVHLANKMGQSKISFDERAQYIDEHINDVVQSAEAPQSGDRWWQEGDEPLQALMACKEISDAMKYSQGHEKFPSRLPVAVDGSCNGLQHYAAIGRDSYGAKLVNLVPSAQPADAYMGVHKEMMKIVEADAANDHQVALRCIGSGRSLDKNHIKRKTIKQSIMTQVYGVTGYGMSKQIVKQFETQNKQHGLWTSTDMNEMGVYIRDKVLESLDVSFKQTQMCRAWLAQICRIVWECQPVDLRKALSWTTPLGLIVRQPYSAAQETHLFTPQGYTKIDEGLVKPAGKKQLSALAPNLIHSLDATHMAMTAIELQKKDVSMMAVHDSYWTHACDLPILADTLRRQFVDLYDRYDPLWEIKEQWEELFFFDLKRHGVKLPDPPKRGDLDLKQVVNSQYFFS